MQSCSLLLKRSEVLVHKCNSGIKHTSDNPVSRKALPCPRSSVFGNRNQVSVAPLVMID